MWYPSPRWRDDPHHCWNPLSYATDTMRAAFAALGILNFSNVASIAQLVGSPMWRITDYNAISPIGFPLWPPCRRRQEARHVRSRLGDLANAG